MMRRFEATMMLLAMAGCAGQSGAVSDIPSPAAAIDPSTASARDALVAAERAFAARSFANGTRDAFLAYLSEDAVLFIPRASPGRPFFEAQPAAAKSRLDWAPIYAEVSRAGDLGFTTGPYEARANAAIDSVTAYGNFVSIWTRDPAANAWKVAVDLGTTNDRPPASRRFRAVRGATVTSRSMAASDADTGAASGIGDRMLTPLGADSALAARAAAEGTAAALVMSASDVRVHREGREPIVGRAAATEMLRRSGERLAWHPAVGVEAQSADLGYTYGTYGGVAPGAAEEGAYVRVWRRGSDGRWRLALDITNPFPP
jgi:ketosteroid isomerase-like protein